MRSVDKGFKNMKEALFQELISNSVFWSYQEPDLDSLSDDMLIEKVLVHSDMDAIFRLFSIYPEGRIRKLWDERILPDIRLRSMNKMFAYLLFGINDPDAYLESGIKKYYENLSA